MKEATRRVRFSFLHYSFHVGGRWTGSDVCPNKRCSLSRSLKGGPERGPASSQGPRAGGSDLCRGGTDHVYVQLIAVHVSSRPAVGTCWVSDLFFTPLKSDTNKNTMSNYSFTVFTLNSNTCKLLFSC